MSRMTTSSASFSWTRAAMRRACSREVSWESSSVIANQCSPVLRTVKPTFLDQTRDGRRDELPDEPGGRCDERAHLSRRGGIRLDLEEDDPLGTGELREHVVELPLQIAGPRGDGEPRPFEHFLRLRPREKAEELVGADDEDRVVEALCAEQLDGAGMRVEADVVARKRGAREREPVLG